MPLVYSCVARGAIVLAEYSPYTGNFNHVASECLHKIKNPDRKFTVTCDRHTFNFRVHDGYTYLAVADEAAGRVLAFACLERIMLDFNDKFARKSRNALPNSLDKTFGPRIKFHMDHLSANPEEVNSVLKVQSQVDAVKLTLQENLTKVMERGDRMDVLEDKAYKLKEQAHGFKASSARIKTAFWYQNLKAKMCVILLCIILLLTVLGVICFAAPNNLCGIQETRMPFYYPVNGAAAQPISAPAAHSNAP